MKSKLIFILSILTIASCAPTKNDGKLKQFISISNEIEIISKKDNGKFWKIPYSTPLLFVNTEDRKVYAFDINMTPYTDILDANILIANTALKWNGNTWAMIQIPLPEQSFMRDKLILHEMFHVLQPQLGFGSLSETTCSHLEQKEARISLRLEMNALLKALEQRGNKDSMYYHLANAFLFRNNRYDIYPEAKKKENLIELNEGIAEYTALMMMQHYSSEKLSENQITTYFNDRVSRFEQDNFIRSFAYETIPLYGYLIQLYIPDWHQKVDTNTNLIDYFMQITNVASIKNGADSYDIENIITEENSRFEQMIAITNAIKEKYLCINHVRIPLIQYNISFDPQKIMAIESIGDLYINAVIIDSWGKLETSKGVILDKNQNRIFLSPPLKVENNDIFGDGWQLHLNDNWKIINHQDEWTEVEKIN